MSKIIDALKAREKETPSPTQNDLADVYFPASREPVLVKIVEKPTLASVFPWLIASLAFLITAFSLFSTKRIFIDVKVIDDKSLYFNQEPAPSQEGPVAAPEAIGEIIKIKPSLFQFEGAAKLSSAKDANLLTLTNSSVAPFARATFQFDKPIDLTHKKIVFSARGYKGGENIAVAIKDQNNISAFTKGKFHPFTGLSTRWQKAEITLMETESGFDSRNVSSIRLEFGSKDTENRPGDTLFVKDIQIIPSAG
ncbi:MAG: hypothetical protein HY592_02905 [Candidatus Omnitrophica bacterium]|nr:hypothetical protein [Candidatus Omnitrophota bacterium]